MSQDINPVTAAFQKAAGLLDYKDPWTDQYSALIGGNTGYNFQRLPKMASEFTFGSSPTPPTNDRGHIIGIYTTFTDNNPLLIDDEFDWTDRLVTFIGQIGPNDSNYTNFEPGGANMHQWNSSIYYDANASPNQFTFISDGSGTYIGLPVIAHGYFAAGNDSPPSSDGQLWIKYYHGTPSLQLLGKLTPKTNGDLYGIITVPASITQGIVLSGTLIAHPKAGYKNL